MTQFCRDSYSSTIDTWSIWVLMIYYNDHCWFILLTPKPAGVLSEMYPAPRQRAGGGPLRAAAAEWQGLGRWFFQGSMGNQDFSGCFFGMLQVETIQICIQMWYIYICIYTPSVTAPTYPNWIWGFTRVYLIFSSCQWGGFPAHFQ